MFDYLIHLAILICIYLIVAQSLNFNFGLGKLFNLAHVGIMALGAYVTAILSTKLDQGPIICLLASIVFCGVVALIPSLLATRIKDEYFAIGTLALAMVIDAVLINWRGLTRGVLGIPGIPRPSLWGLSFQDNGSFLILAIIITVVVLAILGVMWKIRLSQTLRMQAENPQVAQSLGRNVGQARQWSFILASMGAGVAGCLMAYYINYIAPSSFTLHEMVFVLTVIVLARPGSFLGIIFATTFLVLLPELLRFLDLSPAILGPMRQLIYALILFGVVWWRRDSLFPRVREI